jgi:putative nucleotidyltransferase with HDIG domain
MFQHPYFNREYIETTYSTILNDCITKLQSTETTKFVYEHSFKVAQVSLYIYYLISPLSSVNFDNLLIGGLLHDITKARSLKTKEKHALTGGIAAKELGCSQEICDIITQHVDPKKVNGKLTEIDIVCYADKRVKWDYIVTMEERMKDICERYLRNANDEIKKQQEQRDAVYLQIQNEIGELAERNGKKHEFDEFIAASQEGKVERFKGLTDKDYL